MPKHPKKTKEEDLNFITVRIREDKQMIATKKYEFDSKLGVKQYRGKEKKDTGYVLQAFELPLEYLGLTVNSNRKEVLELLNNPSKIPHRKLGEFIKKIIDTYDEIKEERNKFQYKTKRHKRKRKMPQPKQQQTA